MFSLKLHNNNSSSNDLSTGPFQSVVIPKLNFQNHLF